MMLTGTVKSESEQTVQPDHYDGSQGGHGGYNGGGIRGIQRRPWRKRWLLPSRLLLQKLPWVRTVLFLCRRSCSDTARSLKLYNVFTSMHGLRLYIHLYVCVCE